MKIRGAAVGTLALLMAGKVSGLARDVSVGRFFGIGTEADAYYLASSLTAVVFGGVLGAIPLILVPLWADAKSSETPNAAPGLLRQYAGTFGLIALVASAVLLLLPGQTIQMLSEAPAETRAAAAPMIRVMAVTFLLSTAVTIQNALLSANGFAIASYAVAPINNLFFVIGVALLAPTPAMRDVLLFSIVGWALQLAWLPRLGGRFPASDAPRSGSFGVDFRRRALPLTATLYLEYATTFVAVAAASTVGPGAIATWSYASKLGLLISSLFALVLTAGVVPQVAEFEATNQRDAAVRYTDSLLLDLFTVSAPVAVCATVLAPPLAALLLGGSKGAEAVSATLAVLLVALPFQLTKDLATRVAIASGRTRLVLTLSAAALVVTAVLSAAAAATGHTRAIALAVLLSNLLHILALQKAAARPAVFSTLSLSMSRVRALLAASATAVVIVVLCASLTGVHPLATATVTFVSFNVTLRFLGAPDILQVARHYLIARPNSNSQEG